MLHPSPACPGCPRIITVWSPRPGHWGMSGTSVAAVTGGAPALEWAEPGTPGTLACPGRPSRALRERETWLSCVRPVYSSRSAQRGEATGSSLHIKGSMVKLDSGLSPAGGPLLLELGSELPRPSLVPPLSSSASCPGCWSPGRTVPHLLTPGPPPARDASPHTLLPAPSPLS